MRRRIKRASVKFISLVPKGANGLPVLYKEADGHAEFRALSKLDDERGELLAVVYAPDVRDSQGDIASAEVIKQMAYDAAKNGVEIDLRHDGKPVGKDRAYIAEKFIVQKGDARFVDMKDYHGKPVDVTGGWAVMVKIDDPVLRKLYTEGAWNGVSLFGPAEVEIEKTDINADAIADALAKRLKEPPMLTKEELAKMLADSQAATLAEVKKLVEAKAPEKKPEDVKKSDDFDPTDEKQVEARLAKMDREAALAKVDWSDVDSVRAYRDSLKKAPETTEQKVARMEKELAETKTKLAKVQKASNAPAPTTDPTTTVEDGLSKEDREAFTAGREMAEIVNASRGFTKK